MILVNKQTRQVLAVPPGHGSFEDSLTYPRCSLHRDRRRDKTVVFVVGLDLAPEVVGAGLKIVNPCFPNGEALQDLLCRLAVDAEVLGLSVITINLLPDIPRSWSVEVVGLASKDTRRTSAHILDAHGRVLGVPLADRGVVVVTHPDVGDDEVGVGSDFKSCRETVVGFVRFKDSVLVVGATTQFVPTRHLRSSNR